MTIIDKIYTTLNELKYSSVQLESYYLLRFTVTMAGLEETLDRGR